MQLQVPALSDGMQIAYGLAAIVVIAFVIARSSKRPNLDAIPTVGSSTWLGSWWASVRFFVKGANIIQGGYEKHKGTPFKVAGLCGWTVIVSGPQFVEDVRKASEDELCFSANEGLDLDHMLGRDMHDNPYHIAIIRSQLTRNLGTLCPDIRDEVVTALEETLDLRGNVWKSVPAFKTAQKVICRTISRISVGLPLCRNPDWTDLNIRFSLNVVTGGLIIGLFPKVLAPLVARFMTGVPASIRRGMKHLGPIIEERRKHLEEYGKDWADKPNDFLSWLMDHPEASDRSIKELTLRMLVVNLAAVHVGLAFQSFTQALYNLAANPQYMQPLREEVELIVEMDGWSMEALAKMHKVDSFLKECQRLEGVTSVSMPRKAMKDFTFSDGTVLPKGTFLATASQATQLDDEVYQNANMFDPFRFANMRDEDGEGGKHLYVSTNPQYLAFGHGKHACPGRFFAANELKTMLAHVVLSYDIKLEDTATRPRSVHVGVYTLAHPTAKVMFRKRVH
ncbi:hypothetical protein PAXRUDRAFT_775722 [Paxillus rubicundulus Ve08.2h10]|uniref:Cytochrome P450 n=1 Tax=Paxillus rubicundulus Ve08.2h10 TaxID=930991 RepID=A0A0D0D2V7_9AGAM|nr:hypothetical protein PAXRUDRAFT_775722 [Paxillus rubicundulus Ve08.2h10]